MKITTEKIKENRWEAKTILYSPVYCEIVVKGSSEKEAVDKLKLLLEE
jgi:hypothetical protein